jgi:hypothetical protein
MQNRVQRASALIYGRSVEAVPSDSSSRYRCASLLKPLLFWAAAEVGCLGKDWERLARLATTYSANEPTVKLWQEVEPRQLLGVLYELSGVDWSAGAPQSFGRVLVRADEVAWAYGQLLAAASGGSTSASKLLAWMNEVPERQSFGIRVAAALTTGADPSAIAIKCGWDCNFEEEASLRTHALALVPLAPEETIAVAVLTSLPLTRPERLDYAASYANAEVLLDWHWERAARVLAAAVRDALREVS